MSQAFQTTNYLSPDNFYNKFLFWLVRLHPFHSDTGKPPMSVDQFVYAFRIQYGCGLRISEVLRLEKRDFDLKHRILTIRQAKTGKNQKTTILPYDVPKLEKFLQQFSDTEKLFPTSRSTMHEYAKNAGKLAGLDIFESQSNRDIEGIFTHLMRKSCSKRMRYLNASRELRMKKLRHAFRDAHDTYDAVDLNTLILWEQEHVTSEESGARHSIESGKN